jgi:hypothetical protein
MVLRSHPLSRSPSQTPGAARRNRFQRKGARTRRHEKTLESKSDSSSLFCALAPCRLCVKPESSCRSELGCPLRERPGGARSVTLKGVVLRSLFSNVAYAPCRSCHGLHGNRQLQRHEARCSLLCPNRIRSHEPELEDRVNAKRPPQWCGVDGSARFTARHCDPELRSGRSDDILTPSTDFRRQRGRCSIKTDYSAQLSPKSRLEHRRPRGRLRLRLAVERSAPRHRRDRGNRLFVMSHLRKASTAINAAIDSTCDSLALRLTRHGSPAAGRLPNLVAGPSSAFGRIVRGGPAAATAREDHRD